MLLYWFVKVMFLLVILFYQNSQVMFISCALLSYLSIMFRLFLCIGTSVKDTYMPAVQIFSRILAPFLKLLRHTCCCVQGQHTTKWCKFV